MNLWREMLGQIREDVQFEMETHLSVAAKIAAVRANLCFRY